MIGWTLTEMEKQIGRRKCLRRKCFGDDGDFDDDAETDDADFEYDAIMLGLDPNELMDMDEDERDEALEDAGLDPDDYDF